MVFYYVFRVYRTEGGKWVPVGGGRTVLWSPRRALGRVLYTRSMLGKKVVKPGTIARVVM